MAFLHYQIIWIWRWKKYAQIIENAGKNKPAMGLIQICVKNGFSLGILNLPPKCLRNRLMNWYYHFNFQAGVIIKVWSAKIIWDREQFGHGFVDIFFSSSLDSLIVSCFLSFSFGNGADSIYQVTQSLAFHSQWHADSREIEKNNHNGVPAGDFDVALSFALLLLLLLMYITPNLLAEPNKNALNSSSKAHQDYFCKKSSPKISL